MRRRRKINKEARKKYRQKQGHKKRGPLGPLKEPQPTGRGEERRREEKEKTRSHRATPSVCSLMYNTLTKLFTIKEK